MSKQKFSAIPLALLLVVILACPGGASEVVVTADDGLKLHAYFELSPDKSANAPLLVMLPMRGRTQDSYDQFRTAVAARFTEPAGTPGPRPHLLTLDLRGHGASVLRGADTVSYQAMPDSEYQMIPGDVALVIDSMISSLGSRLDREKIYVVGASIGANAAVMVTNYFPNIAKVVMLSPGSNYRGMQPGDAFTAFEGETLIVVARGDGYAYDSAQQLMKLKMKGWLLKAYPSGRHGTTLIDEDDRAMKDVLQWLFPQG